MRIVLTQPAVLVFVGGGAGSLLLYWAGRLIPSTLTGVSFPGAILFVNVEASFVLGVVTGWIINRSAGEEMRLSIGGRLCGGLSTFSSFSYDTFILMQNDRFAAALLNIGLNLMRCLLASAGGLMFGKGIPI